MVKYGLVIEADRCIGCWMCLTSCKDEFVGNSILPYSSAQPDTQYGFYPGGAVRNPGSTAAGSTWVIHGQNWINDVELVQGTFPKVKTRFVPQPCMHCDSAPCQKAATNGAVYTRSDGIVMVDPVLSSGQSNLPASCPYGRMYWNSTSNIAQKCTLCAHLVDAGSNPKCVDSCPIGAIHFGDLSNPSSNVSQLIAAKNGQPLHPEYGTKPKVYYTGLPTPFLTGKVVDGRNGDYIQGATLTITPTDGSSPSVTASTDNYADFEFDNLVAGKSYMVTATATGMLTMERVVFLDEAKDIGKIQLFP